MSFWGLPGGRRAFSPRGAAGGGAGRGGEHSGGERGRERAAGGAAGRGGRARRGGGAGRGEWHGRQPGGRGGEPRRAARQATRRARRRAPAGGAAGNPAGAGESPGGRRGRRRGGRGGEPRRAARQAARRSLWADAAALHGKARPPAQARAWSGRGARTAAPPAPTLGKKRRMQDYAVFCAACPPARTSYAQRQPPKKQGIVDNVVDNVDKSAARMWKIPLHTRPPRMHFPSPFAFLSRKKSRRSRRPKPQTGYFSF